MISSIKSSIATILRHDSSAGFAAASIVFRLMTLAKKSRPPINAITLVGRACASR